MDGGDLDVEAGDVRGGEAELDKGGGGDSSSKVSSWERGARTTRGWQGLPWSGQHCLHQIAKISD